MARKDKEKAREYAVAYRAANKDKIAAYTAANSKKRIAYQRLRNTGVTQEQYDEAYLKQTGLCAICSKECASGRKLSADHCHTTGVFRGLLCTQCNTGLGKFKDDLTLMEKAMNYLRKHNAPKKF
jgi:hypothetical protein